jgi:hypothetical protein
MISAFTNTIPKIAPTTKYFKLLYQGFTTADSFTQAVPVSTI